MFTWTPLSTPQVAWHCRHKDPMEYTVEFSSTKKLFCVCFIFATISRQMENDTSDYLCFMLQRLQCQRKLFHVSNKSHVMPSEAMSRERETETETDRQTDRQTETHTETQRQIHTETDRDTHKERTSHTEREREIKTNERARCSHSAKATKVDVRQILCHKNL